MVQAHLEQTSLGKETEIKLSACCDSSGHLGGKISKGSETAQRSQRLSDNAQMMLQLVLDEGISDF